VSSVLDCQGAVAPANQGRRGRLLLIVGAIAFAVVVLAWALYDARRSSNWTLYPVDLGVYRSGGLIVRHISPPYNAALASPLYDWDKGTTLQFTYTPFSAVAFALISFVPAFLDSRLEEAVNVVALVAACWFAMRALGYSSRRMLAGGALLGAAAGLLTEPVYRTIYLGQINIVLMLMVIWDLTPPENAGPWRRRFGGFLTGVAAGIKLIPLVFTPYLLVTRRFREAAGTIAGFVFTVVVGFIVIPGDSGHYWFKGLFVQDGRTGFAGWGGDQSLHGLVTRLAGSLNAANLPWLVACLIAAVVALWAAAVLYRSGHQLLALLTAALLGLLDSPISWDHHWVWVVPGMMAAGHYGAVAWRAGLHRRAIGCAVVAIGLLLVYFPWPGWLWSLQTSGPGNFTWGLIWAAPNSKVITYMLDGDNPLYSEYHWHGLQLLAGNAFVLGGLAALVILAGIALRLHLRARGASAAAAATRTNSRFPGPNAQTSTL
jgi:alpha-1,2-mannosyltransferase